MRSASGSARMAALASCRRTEGGGLDGWAAMSRVAKGGGWAMVPSRVACPRARQRLAARAAQGKPTYAHYLRGPFGRAAGADRPAQDHRAGGLDRSPQSHAGGGGKIERALKLDVPTREEQQEIEASSRLYQENGAHFMTATVLYQAYTGEPDDDAGDLHPDRPAPDHACVTRDLRAFSIFATRCRRPEVKLTSGTAVLIGLIETLIDRLADSSSACRAKSTRCRTRSSR